MQKNSQCAALFGMVLGANASAGHYVTYFEDEFRYLTDYPAVETFEGFDSGTTVTSLPGIREIRGYNSYGESVEVMVTSEDDLPFGMFKPENLPSGQMFLSNDLRKGSRAAGKIEFVFESPSSALGFYIADSNPLDRFQITLYNGVDIVAEIETPRRFELPYSFIGVLGPPNFTSAVIGSRSRFDAWGIDDLYVVNSVPGPSSVAVLAAAVMCFPTRRR